MIKITLLTAVALTLTMGASLAAEPATIAPPSAKGGMFVTTGGMTLYTFDKDAPGKSNCNGPCATNWPPAAAGDGARAAGDWTIVSRDDGLKQWAYKGKPVYAWVKDTKPGDTTGDGFLNGAWHIAKP